MTKKNNLGGLRKGFLLSESNKSLSKQAKIATASRPTSSHAQASSSTLIDVEEKVEEYNDQQSIFFIGSSNSQNLLGKSGSSNSKLLNSSECSKPSLMLPLRIGDDSDEHSIGIREVSSGKIHEVVVETEKLQKVTTSCSFIDKTSTLVQCDNGSFDEPISLTQSSFIEKEFFRTLWKIPKVSNPHQISQQFIDNCLVSASHWRHAWMLVFDRLAQTDADSSSAVELGYEMMHSYGMKLPATFIVLVKDRKSRVSAFGAATFFEIVALKCLAANANVMRDLLALVYPGLIQIANDGCTNRSRLSQQAFQAACTIVALSSEVYSIYDEFIIALPGLDCLLEIQQKWIKSSLANKTRRIQLARKHCTLAVISNWRTVLKDPARRKFNCTLRIGDSCFGGLVQTVCSKPDKIEAKIIIARLSEAKDSESSSFAIRGLAAWLGNNKRHLQDLTIAANNIVVVEKLITSLQDGLVDMILTILNYLWSESSGLPQGEETKAAIFSLLVEVVRKMESRETTDNIDTANPSIYALLAKFVIDGDSTRLDEFVELSGDHPMKVEVLSCIVSDGENKLDQYAATFLFICVGHSSVLRRKMKTTSLFRHLATEFLVPLIIDVTCTLTNNDSTSKEIFDALSNSMSQKLEECLRSNEINHFVDSFVEKLLSIEVSCESKASKICECFAPRWREVLLVESLGLGGYCQVLLAIARAVLRSPSSVGLLAMLGLFVGEPANYDFDSQRSRQSVFFGIRSVVQLCSHHLQDTSQSESRCDIFKRLSPLLLLRRIPSQLYQLAWKFSFGNECFEKADTVSTLSLLANEISARLTFEEPEGCFGPEERRLSAEVAGHCLPFDIDPACSCFQRICQPAFIKALNGYSAPAGESFKPAKIALYAVVYFLTVSVDPGSSDGLFATVAFALLMCEIPTPSYQLTEHRDLTQLQTLGCIELFASCLEQFFAYGKSDMSDIALSLSEILTDDSPDLEWAEKIAKRLFNVDSNLSLTIEMRFCLWKSFLEVSKRCPEKDGLLKRWAKSTMPLMIRRATMTYSIDSNHPLSAANALQVVFILIVRTKSLECVEMIGTPAKTVHLIFHWALNSIEHPPHDQGTRAVTLVKTAGLKLLVAIITIDQTRSGGVGHLDSMQVMKSLAVLKTVAASDYEPEVQQLAAQMLSTLKVQ